MALNFLESAPVHLNPIIERLWSERIDCRRRGDDDRLREVSTQLILQVLTQAVTGFDHATFEIERSSTAVTVHHPRLFNIADQQLVWSDHLSTDESKLLKMLLRDLVQIEAAAGDSFEVAIRAVDGVSG